MKEYLKRELNKTYLVLSSEDSGYTENYEIGMLTNNETERILPLHVLRMDGTIEIYYDISSKQTLMDCAGRLKLTFEVIKNLFGSISQMMKEETKKGKAEKRAKERAEKRIGETA